MERGGESCLATVARDDTEGLRLLSRTQSRRDTYDGGIDSIGLPALVPSDVSLCPLGMSGSGAVLHEEGSCVTK